MPELPEVETIANGVNSRVQGSSIRSVWMSDKPQTFKSSREDIEAALTGSKIVRVHRVGKTIVCDLQQPGGSAAQWLIHLGMTGRLLVADPNVPPPPHTHLIASLQSGHELRFTDPRRFGRISVSIETYTGPGSEPLTITPEAFIALFHNRKTPIKAALLNQKLLHGVGNIYADESLFRAGILPKRQAGRLTRAELTRLHTALKAVLKRAIKLGGSSVSDYVDAEGMRGYFQIEHHVYLRTGQPCHTCKTTIRKITIGGRSTHFCPNCQH
ncbi:MAG: bifunctional DNA-formamidopyrimidine glycosylase/DNA-(apurinic or apyrimidinic site) lyase [Acidobacteriaceae bacterium]|nr:bifunctional DNA-formamidopyrimidine glycosylase/DNA-(apurinic or apyrimidinic site) lyase [Acidobacteriaceae bacterium]